MNESTKNRFSFFARFRDIYIGKRIFYIIGLDVILFIASFWLKIFYPIGQFVFFILIALFAIDFYLLFFQRGNIQGKRRVNDQLSLGDPNTVHLYFKNEFDIPLKLYVYDELPYQLQQRNLSFQLKLKPKEEEKLAYTIHPLKRGSYEFDAINVFVSSSLRILQRRFRIESKQRVGVYPSIIQMRKHTLNIFSSTANYQGIKQVRRLGNTSEFEQIKNYVQGDNFKHINWKATSRRNEIMVNQYEDERSQQVYFIIDKSRSMKMPFEGLSLLDHAINSTLAISNIALRKGDKAGLITFSSKIGDRVKADRKGSQLKLISEVLHRQKTQFLDSNYELMYQSVRDTVKGRSLVFLFTNFESESAAKRVIPILRRLNRNHLLVVVFFENSELQETSTMECNSLEDIYLKTFAQESVSEKRFIVHELRKLGIQSMLTKPEDLTVNTINKYLELKSRGMI